jgi:4-hydroxythreonine-4-phosphate dehydrogenase
MTAESHATIALAIGDPNGIGPEIAVKAAAALAQGDGPRVILVGDPHVIRFYGERAAAGLPLREIAGQKPRAGDRALYIHGVDALPSARFRPGQVEPEAGRATVAYISAAIDLVRSGTARAIVGCPHNETAVNAAGIPFFGYPGLLARLTGTPEDRVFLMLVGGGLRILHATLHERLQSALARLTPDLVEAAARAALSALATIGVANPRIGIFGINPHAGEGGLFGDDDEKVTVPAIARLRKSGFQVEGPIGADVMLGRRDIDGFVAMYHDQGHIPVKLLAGRTASALSVGAGVLFSSVGHGSAFDIAGKGIADPEAVLRTLRLVAGAKANASLRMQESAA